MAKKRIKFKSILLDIFVIAACLTACAYCLKYFFLELNRTTVRTDISAIGKIEYKYKVAQRKFEDRVVWERLQQNSTLYSGDIIRTSSQAQALISFLNNSTLELDENTMLQIFINDDGDFLIELDSGTVSVESQNVSNKSNVNLSMKNGSSVMLKPGASFSVESTKDGDANFSVKNGEVTLKNKDGLEQKVIKGESFTQTKEGTLTKKAISALSPSKVLKFDSSPVSVKVDVNIEPEYQNQNLVVETSLSPNFTPIKDTFIKSANNDDITLFANEGKLYWRVYPENQKENITSGDVNILKTSTVTLLSPTKNQKIGIVDNVLVDFIWQASDYATHYKFQLAHDSSFSRLITSQDVYDTTYSYEFNIAELSDTSKQYFWRVVPYYAISQQGHKTSSPSSSFILEEQSAYVTDTQENEVVASSTVLSESAVGESAKSAIEIAMQKAGLSSNIQDENDIQTNNSQESDVKVEEKVEVKEVKEEPKQEVKPSTKKTTSKTSTTKKSSNTKSATTKPSSTPKTVEQSAKIDEQSKIEQENTTQKDATSQKQEPSSADAQKQDAQESSSAETQKQDINASQETSQENSSETPPEEKPTISEPVIESLDEPVLLEPLSDTVIDTQYLIANNRTIVFLWNSVEHATDYTFELYQVFANGQKKRVFEQKNILETRFEFSDLSKLQNGNFEWRVTAYRRTGMAETTLHSDNAVEVFEIKINMPSKITPIDPGKQYGD